MYSSKTKQPIALKLCTIVQNISSFTNKQKTGKSFCRHMVGFGVRGHIYAPSDLPSEELSDDFDDELEEFKK